MTARHPVTPKAGRATGYTRVALFGVWLAALLFAAPSLSFGRSPAAAPSSMPASKPSSQETLGATRADSPPPDDEHKHLFDAGFDLFSSSLGGGFWRLKPKAPGLLAPVGGVLLADLLVFLGGSTEQRRWLGIAFKTSGLVGFDSGSGVLFDGSFGLGPTLGAGSAGEQATGIRATLFGGVGLGGLGVFAQAPGRFTLPATVYAQLGAHVKLLFGGYYAFDLEAAYLARPGQLNELQCGVSLADLWRLTPHGSSQRGTTLGLSYRRFEDQAEMFLLTLSKSLSAPVPRW